MATLWQSLHRLVSMHPLVRSAQRNQNNSKGITSVMSLPDLTQDLYVQLLEKSRFHHYVQKDMTDADIEREIFQVELTNMLIGRLRRRQPENYRIVRRIGGILESHPQFRMIRQPEKHQAARYRQAVNVLYGLRDWSEAKPLKESGVFEDLITNISMRSRNRRRTGCKGDTQLIVSTQELVDLLVEIFKAIDSPISLRNIRSLALTKVPVYDAVVSSIDQIHETENSKHGWERISLPLQACPEQLALRMEEAQLASQAVQVFLHRLDRMTRFRLSRTEKLWRILWHYYFDPEEPSQLTIAAMLDMSDSSVSDYRRRMEQEIHKLVTTEFSLEQFHYFAEELSSQLRNRMSRAEETRQRVTAETTRIPAWTRFTYSSLLSMEGVPTV